MSGQGHVDTDTSSRTSAWRKPYSSRHASRDRQETSDDGKLDTDRSTPPARVSAAKRSYYEDYSAITENSAAPYLPPGGSMVSRSDRLNTDTTTHAQQRLHRLSRGMVGTDDQMDVDTSTPTKRYRVPGGMVGADVDDSSGTEKSAPPPRISAGGMPVGREDRDDPSATEKFGSPARIHSDAAAAGSSQSRGTVRHPDPDTEKSAPPPRGLVSSASGGTAYGTSNVYINGGSGSFHTEIEHSGPPPKRGASPHPSREDAEPEPEMSGPPPRNLASGGAFGGSSYRDGVEHSGPPPKRGASPHPSREDTEPEPEMSGPPPRDLASGGAFGGSSYRNGVEHSGPPPTYGTWPMRQVSHNPSTGGGAAYQSTFNDPEDSSPPPHRASNGWGGLARGPSQTDESGPGETWSARGISQGPPQGYYGQNFRGDPMDTESSAPAPLHRRR
ncbi:hypothetical protein M427DRAFT_268688 [Gonapodya prolifera JEL478]|uniref:Uncharacterized protein n=1 Tax=Gonapodya prolifera (strain JEL478) TaxID=1344416 RepID=A0A139AJP5_GONPJ|nr:hypothetical protein M427DRAFT_268688 [Gonapodya prolifera JEL478]|eukprot:KXS16991.1 hypothetical protein M427DRAFT_268688 [Gonapodya prolifera JEL478]